MIHKTMTLNILKLYDISIFELNLYQLINLNWKTLNKGECVQTIINFASSTFFGKFRTSFVIVALYWKSLISLSALPDL